jgi:hypothetical protein
MAVALLALAELDEAESRGMIASRLSGLTRHNASICAKTASSVPQYRRWYRMGKRRAVPV